MRAFPGTGQTRNTSCSRRLWDRMRPAVVMLVVCVQNDRNDNAANVRYEAYRPYFEIAPDGGGDLRGQPVPRSRHLYFKRNWLAENFWLARFAISAYVELRNPRIRVPDPTERLLEMVQNFVREQWCNFPGRPDRSTMPGLKLSSSAGMSLFQCSRAPGLSPTPASSRTSSLVPSKDMPPSQSARSKLLSDAGVLSLTKRWPRSDASVR